MFIAPYKNGFNARWNFRIRNKAITPINKDLLIELWETINQRQIEKEI